MYLPPKGSCPGDRPRAGSWLYDRDNHGRRDRSSRLRNDDDLRTRIVGGSLLIKNGEK